MLPTYIEYFQSLHTSKMRGQVAPHKAILLLSVMDLIERGVIVSNKIQLTESLERQFLHNWKKYVGESEIFRPKVGTPYWHLNSEPFWRLVPFSGGEEKIRLLQQGNPYTPSTLRSHIAYAELDSDLFELMKEQNGRARLRVTLIKNYF